MSLLEVYHLVSDLYADTKKRAEGQDAGHQCRAPAIIDTGRPQECRRALSKPVGRAWGTKSASRSRGGVRSSSQSRDRAALRAASAAV